jgi:hypothetical protein
VHKGVHQTEEEGGEEGEEGRDSDANSITSILPSGVQVISSPSFAQVPVPPEGRREDEYESNLASINIRDREEVRRRRATKGKEVGGMAITSPGGDIDRNGEESPGGSPFARYKERWVY